MPLQSFSDRHRGLFVTVDGPSGAGKSTCVDHLARLLISAGEQVHITAEPSSSMVGMLAREATERVTGPALACLYAADRYHHLDSEIRPRLAEGIVVLCDRYVPSGLVMQRFDGVDPSFLWAINALAERPDLAVILEADPAVIAARLTARGPRNRFQALPGSAHGEAVQSSWGCPWTAISLSRSANLSGKNGRSCSGWCRPLAKRRSDQSGREGPGSMKGAWRVDERYMKGQCALVPSVQEVPNARNGCGLLFHEDPGHAVVPTDGVRAD